LCRSFKSKNRTRIIDVATGVGSATNVEYIPYHICSSKTVLHRIYKHPAHPSHLLLPVIPEA
jgi:hypothetical protein